MSRARSRFAVLGADGMLGRALVEELQGRGEEPVVSTFADLDVTDAAAAERLFEEDRPAIVFNATGHTNVDGAEMEADEAERVNAMAPGLLGEAAARAGALLVHVSTDYVFDGSKGEPYTEDDWPSPLSAYARTKLAGEEAVRASGARHLIVRTAWLFAPWGRNFVLRIVRRAHAGEPLRVVDDQRGSPTYAPDLACAMVDLALSGAEGDFCAVNSGEATWCELARETVALVGLDAKVLPITTPEYPTPAVRPRYSVLSAAKLEETLRRPLRHWRAALADCLSRAFSAGA